MEATTVQRELDRAKELTLSWRDPEPLRPTLLFRGNVSPSRSLALWKFTLALKEHEVASVTDATRFSREKPDLRHILGLHTALAPMAIQGWLGRLIQSPAVLNLDSGLSDYLHWFIQNSERYQPFLLDPISRWSQWSKRPWRRPQGKSQPRIVEVWPFIEGEPTNDHDLLLAVDGIVPKGLSEGVRQDVCQEILCALFAAEVAFEELSPSLVGNYVRKVYRYSPYGEHSLEAPAWVGDSDGKRLLKDTVRAQSRESEPQAAYLATESGAEIRAIIGNRSIEDIGRLDPNTLMWLREQLSEAGFHGGVPHPEDAERLLRGPPPRRFADTGARPRRGRGGRRGVISGKPGQAVGDGSERQRGEQRQAAERFEDDLPDLSEIVRWDDPRWKNERRKNGAGTES